MEASFARTLAEGDAGFESLIDAIERFLAGSAIPQDVAAKLMLVFDEVISNALVHGCEGRVPAIDIAITIDAGRISAQVTDDGKPFDPLSAAAPDTTLSAEDRPIGGLGILLVRRLMDDVRYTRENGRNRLRFSKDFPVVPTPMS